MIYWKDFAFDEVLGPSLVLPEKDRKHRMEPGRASVMDDASSRMVNQETRREQPPARPARMASQASMGKSSESIRQGMEAECLSQVESVAGGEV